VRRKCAPRHRRHIGEAEALRDRARVDGGAGRRARVVAATDGMRVIRRRSTAPSLRAVDLEGAIRIQRSNAASSAPTPRMRWRCCRRAGTSQHEMFLVLGAHVIDLGGIASRAQALRRGAHRARGRAGRHHGAAGRGATRLTPASPDLPGSRARQASIVGPAFRTA
jgi:hypothetical protein